MILKKKIKTESNIEKKNKKCKQIKKMKWQKDYTNITQTQKET